MRSKRDLQRGWRGLAGVLAFTALTIPLTFGVAAGQDAESHPKLPPGPIRERHELMEKVGDAAKAIGAASKAGKPADAAAPAETIAAALLKAPGLFPAGSESPLSRAKPNIWTEKAKFDELALKGHDAALVLAAAAKSGGELKGPSSAMFQTCKACHDQFRQPKEGE
jgi:cytochrome c556